MSNHNARVGCPSAKTIHKILMRGVRGRSRTSIKVYVPLSAYPEHPPVFVPPGKQLYNNVWQMPSVDGAEVEIRIDNYSANYDPRVDAESPSRIRLLSEDGGLWRFVECAEYTILNGNVVSVKDANPAILDSYLAREVWFDRYLHGEAGHGTNLVQGLPWVEALTSAVYGWFTKGTSHEIIGNYLAFEPTVKSCYLSRVRAFSRELAAALKVCAVHGVNVQLGRGGAW